MDGGNWKEMFCAVTAGDLELVRYHLRMGIDPNFQHPEVLSLPLVESARLGNVAITALLLRSGADPTLKAGWEGVDALTMATSQEQADVARMLREHLGLPEPQPWWRRLLGRLSSASSLP